MLADCGHFPLRFYWWQQLRQYHNRINNMSDDSRLVKCAFVAALHDPSQVFWIHRVQDWLQLQFASLTVEDDIDVADITDSAKNQYVQTMAPSQSS